MAQVRLSRPAASVLGNLTVFLADSWISVPRARTITDAGEIFVT